MLVFCLEGHAELHFGSFAFGISEGGTASVVTMNGYRLRECRAAAGTLLLVYLPRGIPHAEHFYEDRSSDFMTISPDKALLSWARAVALRVEADMACGDYSFCAVGVLLRDRSGGAVPWPFACSPGCPAWGYCAATAGFEADARLLPGQGPYMPPPTLREKVLSTVAAVVGIGLFGGLLLYFTLKDLIGMWSQ